MESVARYLKCCLSSLSPPPSQVEGLITRKELQEEHLHEIYEALQERVVERLGNVQCSEKTILRNDLHSRDEMSSKCKGFNSRKGDGPGSSRFYY